MMKLPNATRQAPDAESAAADGSESKRERKTVSKRTFLGGEKIEEAKGARYTLLDPNGNHDLDYTFGQNSAFDRMCAIFGFHTKIGNVANTVLNDKDEPGTPADAAQSIREWMTAAMSANPQWAERSAGGVGSRVDRDALAGAFVTVVQSEGKITAEQADATYATVRQRLEDGYPEKSLTAAQYMNAIRKQPAVAAEYLRRVGKEAKSIDDLL